MTSSTPKLKPLILPYAPQTAVDDPDILPDLKPIDVSAIRQYERDERFFDDCLHMLHISPSEREDIRLEPPLDYKRISARYDVFRGISADMLSDSHPAKRDPFNCYLSPSFIESMRFHHGVADIDIYPSCIKIRPKRVTPRLHQLPAGGRGKITGFSMESRRRLMDVLFRVDWRKETVRDARATDAHTYFITLTYGDDYPTDFEDYKNDLRIFQKRLDRWLNGRYSAIWKLEFQNRGAPHYHLVLFSRRLLSADRLNEWVSDNWAEIITNRMGYDATYQDTIRAVHAGEKSSGRCVLPAYNPDGEDCTRLVNYLSKYMAKPFKFVSHDNESVKVFTGRCWGIWHKDNLPLVPVHHMSFVDWQDFKRFLLAVRSWGREIGSEYLQNITTESNFTLFGDGLQLFQLANDLSQRGFHYVREDGYPSWLPDS